MQAAALNLDPSLDYWYGITYIREGYSLTVATGEFEVMANPTNKGAQSSYTGTGIVFQAVATLDGKNLLTVGSSMPMPAAGAPGTGAYTIAKALAPTVGNSVTHPLTDIAAPGGRAVQVGDVIFSSVTPGTLATVQSLGYSGTPSATLLTRQVFGSDALKALLDVTLRIPAGGGANLETPGFLWTVPKADVPLPTNYVHNVGDMLFSHSAASGLTANKKLIISLVEVVGSTTLSVRTKIVFPIFLEEIDVEHLVGAKVDKTTTVNGLALSTNISLTADDVAEGIAYKRLSAANATKLAGLPTVSELNTSLAGKANSSHTHTIANVSGLSVELDAKVASSTVDEIWTGTQAAYDAIASKNPATLYIIKA